MGLFSSPKIPDPNVAAQQGMAQDLANYPFEAEINNLARMGGKATINGQEYDFTGLGDADNAAAMSDKMAQTLLDIQQNYGPDYVKQRLDELKAADPTGYAARKQLFDSIIADANTAQNRPMNRDLQKSVEDELSKGGQLTDRQTQEVQQSIRGGQIGRGIFLGNAAASQEANAVLGASNDLKAQRQQTATGILNSGVLPQDVQYRQIQQSLANLGAFNNGSAPTTQFQSLSASGAAPMFTGAQNQASFNPNAASQGQGNALQLYQANTNWANSQVNPWTAGITGGVAGYNLSNKAGWN